MEDRQCDGEADHLLQDLEGALQQGGEARHSLRRCVRAHRLRCGWQPLRVFEFQIIDRQNMRSMNLQPSLDLRLENGSYTRLSKQLAEAARLIRNMRGKDLHVLTIEELQQLETILETGRSCVRQRKSKQIMEHISNLQKRGIQLMEENTRLRHWMGELSRLDKQALVDSENAFNDDGLSSESVVTLTLNENNDNSDSSLKLGLSYSAWKRAKITEFMLRALAGEDWGKMKFRILLLQ